MTFQITLKDVKNAIRDMHSNTASVICSENPRRSCTVTILCSDEGEIYTEASYVVGNVHNTLGKNVPLSYLVNKFNAEMAKQSEEE